MFKFIKKNQKKVLAFFMVGLMIAFMLPAAMTNMTRTGNTTRGHIGKQELSDREVREAHAEWILLKENIFVLGRPDPFSRTPQLESIADRLGANQFDWRTGNGRFVRGQIDAHPEAFALLIHEAHAMGAAVSPDEMNTALINAQTKPDGQPEFEQRVNQAVSDMLLVQAAFNRASDVVKVTDPERMHMLGTYMQSVSFDVVDFDAKKYLATVPAPTEKEIADQYARHSNVEPDPETGRMGYKLPDRVKVQYVEIPASQLEKVATQGIRDQDMRLYWLQHPSKYMTTQPTKPDEYSPSPFPAAPTTKPFAAVREQVFNDMKQEKMDDLSKSILLDLSATLNGDYSAWKKAVGGPEHPTSMPADLAAKAPETPVGAPYHRYEYLKKVALETQQKFNVLPVVAEVGDYLSLKELTAAQQEPAAPPATRPTAAATGPTTGPGKLPTTLATTFPVTLPTAPVARAEVPPKVPHDLATASAVDFESVQFPRYAVSFVAPLANEREARYYRIPVLSLDEPSLVLKDMNANSWMFRVTAIDPAHPQPLADVREQVVADARRVKAQQLAKADAEALAGEAKKGGLGALAATRPSLKIQSTGLLKRNASGDIAKALAPYELPNDAARQAFVEGAFELLSSSDPGDPKHPVGVVEIPPADRAATAQVNQVKPIWSTESAGETEISQQVQVMEMRMQFFRNAWFKYDAVKARLNYQPADTGKKSSEPQPDQSQQPSDNPF